MTTRTSALKRLLSGLLALCLVLSLMPMMPLELTAEAADTTKTVYVGVIEYITDFVPTLHYWGSGVSGNATLTATGETVQFSVGSSYWDNAAQNFRVYKAEVPVDATGAKTWDEGSNGKWASEDVTLSGDDLILLFEWGGTYHNQKASYDPVEPVSVTVYCINSNKWAEVAAYAWNEGGAGTSWPGIKMSKTGQSVNGFDVYEVTFDVAYENVIFNNNNNGSQTENLSLNEGQYYDTKSGTWYASLDEVPVIDPLATDRYLVGEFNSWSTIANEFKLDAEGSATGYISLELNANTKYEFKIVREGTWTSCATPITGTVAGLTFSSSVGDNCVITTTDAGVYVFSFGVDNSMLSVTYPGCNHAEQEVIPGYDADCDTSGLTDGMKCSVCGAILVKQEEIPASGHAKPVYTNNGETHSVDYPCCDALDSAAEDHDFANEAHKCACGKVETFTVSWYNNGKLTEQTYEFGATVEGFIPEREYINSEMFRGWNDFRCWKDLETSDVITLPFTMPAHSVEIYASKAFTGWVGGPDKIAYYYAVKDVEQSGWLCVNDENELVTDGSGTWYYAGTDFQIVTDVTEIEGVLYAFDHSTGAFLNDYTGVYETNDGDLCYVENGIVIPAKLHQASISLNGNIAINYYMLLSDKVLSDENAYMQFTMADGEVITVPVSQGVAHDGYYVFTCEVAAKEMTDDVVSQFFYEGGSTVPFTYNVKAYADTILGSTSISDELRTLVEAILNYGAASQIHFGYNTDKLANGGNNPDYTDVVIEGYGAVASQGTKLATLYSASLILKSETTLRFFFQVDSSVENFTATHDGKTLEVKQRGGFYYVDVVGIAAKDLDKDVTITISDGTESAEVFFNPMAYCQGVQNDDTGTYTQQMKDLVAAIYLYNQAANNYFKER